MNKWSWQIYSVLASILTMVFVYAIVNLPLKEAAVPAAGLVVLHLFLLKNPVGRYLRLAAITLSVWVGLVSGTAYRFEYFHEKYGEAFLSFNAVEWYVHVCLLVVILALLFLDFQLRKPSTATTRSAITQNRLKKYKYMLAFYSYVLLLGFIVLIVILLNGPPPVPAEIEIREIARKVDFRKMGYTTTGERHDVVEFHDTVSFSSMPKSGNYSREFQVPPGTTVKVYDLVDGTEVTPPSVQGGKQEYGQAVFKIDPERNQAKIRWEYKNAHGCNREGVGFSSSEYLVRSVDVTYQFPEKKGLCGSREFKPPRLESGICRRRSDGFKCENIDTKSEFRELWNWNIWSECSSSQKPC